MANTLRRRSRSYSIAEAERIALRLPLQRKFSALEAAHAAAQFVPADPASWLELAGQAGLVVKLIDGGLVMMMGIDGDCHDAEQVGFLKIWLALTPGGDEAVKALLEARVSV